MSTKSRRGQRVIKAGGGIVISIAVNRVGEKYGVNG